jgi:hypothetical protein
VGYGPTIQTGREGREETRVEHVDWNHVGEQRRLVGQEINGQTTKPNHEDERDEQHVVGRISLGRRSNSNSAASAANTKAA